MIRKRSRARRIAKWTGVVVCVVIVVTFVASHWWSIEWVGGRCRVFVGGGGVYFVYGEVAGQDIVLNIGQPGWFTGAFGITEGGDVRRVYGVPHYWGFQYWASPENGVDAYLTIPLWLPFLLTTVPTFILWRRDRRPPPGHCQRCGYNLTGNVSGRCPECGEAT